MNRKEAYDLALSVYRGETDLASVPTGTVIRVLAYCVHQEEACLDNIVTRQFVDNAMALLNTRLPI